MKQNGIILSGVCPKTDSNNLTRWQRDYALTVCMSYPAVWGRHYGHCHCLVSVILSSCSLVVCLCLSDVIVCLFWVSFISHHLNPGSSAIVFSLQSCPSPSSSSLGVSQVTRRCLLQCQSTDQMKWCERNLFIKDPPISYAR